MNQHLQTVLNAIQEDRNLSVEEKNAIIKSLKDANKEFEIISFKLDRTEKVKRTTAILLEETIEELEQKRKAVEAQNKELEIEAALERVRTVAMSMIKPDDLLNIGKALFHELKLLGFTELRNALINTFNDEQSFFYDYDYSDLTGGNIVTIPYDSHPLIKQHVKKIRSSTDAFAETVVQESELESWKENRRKNGEVDDPRFENIPALYYYFYSIGIGAIGISAYKKISDEQLSILKRFRNVFDLAYKRYIDITNAEAQAREANIEAALEKVRSRSLAMHKSDEIKDVVKTVVEKITELNIEMNGGVSLVTFLPESKDLLHWLWIPEQLDDVFKAYLPYFNHIIFTDCDNAREQGLELIGKVYSGEDKQTYFNHLFHQTDFSAGPEEVKAWVMQQPHFGFSFAIQKHSGIFLNDYTGKFFSEETNNILVRFSKVFEQSYIRFLDMQKAEAQSRENQIQLALERARTQSMIMQHSSELDDTLRVFHEQVLLLGIHSAFSFLWLPDEDKDKHIFWAAWAENNATIFNSKAINYPLDRNEPATAQCLVDWKSNEPVVSYHVPPEGVENYFAAWSELIAGVEQLKPEYFIDGLYYVEAFMKYGCFGVMVKSELQEDEKKILARFAIEFEQTYTRFLDLQKAEAQTRESQIQLALERVRARTMAMQHSDELSETASEMFQQIQSLGLKTWSCGFNIIDKEKRLIIQWVSSGDGRILPSFVTPSDEDVFKRFTQAAEKDKSLYVEEMGGEALKAHYQYMASLPEVKKLLDEFQSLEITPPDFQVFHLASFSYGYLMFITYQPAPEFYDVFKRFANVFDQTYRRFLDLQKAEAQSRESQIQLALERVRARTMAMHQSNELADTASILFQQIKELGFETWSCGFCIWAKNDLAEVWMAADSGGLLPPMMIPYKEEPTHAEIYKASLRGEPAHNKIWEGKELEKHYAFLKTLPSVKTAIDILEKSGLTLPLRQCYYVGFFKEGYLLLITKEPNEGLKDLSKRFASVFDLTYTRFLDLQKAEAQAREAEIELALERVRARTMAMQHSDELADASFLLDSQVRALGIKTWGCAFNIYGENESTEWFSSEAGTMPAYKTPRENIFLRYYEAGQRGEAMHIEEFAREACVAHYDYLCTVPVMGDALKEVIANGGSFPTRQIDHATYFKYGYLLFITFEPVPEAHDIFKRFAKVFEQTYTRFLDLQKAEAQAREAQIEAALERVRSRSMGMQKSEELKDIIQVVYEQFVHLNINVEHTGFIMDYKERDDMLIWLADKHAVPFQVIIPYFDSPHWNSFNEARATGREFFANHLNFEEKNNFYQDLFKLFPVPQEAQEYYFSCPGLAISTVLLDNVGLYIENFSAVPYTDIENNTLMRFGKVFQQTYTRFNDLKQAEAQAKEAKIETALERVRSSAMAMHSSEGLLNVTHVLRDQMALLEQKELESILIHIYNEEKDTFEAWFSYRHPEDPNGNIIDGKTTVSWSKTARAYKDKEKYHSNETDYTIVADYNMLKEWYEYLQVIVPSVVEHDDQGKILVPDVLYYNYSRFSGGALLLITNDAASNDSKYLLKRSAEVFNLAYTRFLDLKKAEAQAKEAQIEAALERVRSRTLAMQKSDELAETAAVLFKQLILLGIEPNRLYISIMKEDEGETEFWITDEDGSKVSMAYEDNLNNNPSFKKMFDGWKQQKKSLVLDMKGKVLADYFNYLSSIHVPFKGGLAQKRRLQYIAYFNKGFIGMASPDEQPEETMLLLERFAAVFNLTFTRFNDLKIAEAHAVQAEEDLIKLQTEKARAEDALTELKETQKQLVQSEKMASLGELTAGIAHEIQNPLNFVNNFSEVSKELLDEMKAALDSGNKDEAEEIANDIIQNLEKINHHGKRADAIVKGMLQHSRKSDGVKELTDINALCDEYVRLCYHGLRAKDNSFNSTIKTDFDNSIDKINIIPQDISRVILNVLTNAFYAVNEKKKTLRPVKGSEEYAPTVIVGTKAVKSFLGNSGVEIIITDNGNGIPRNIVDKIFQPFFTTKPTGQGTGLGLSLSYDIIKAHGGELKVETKEGEGTDFIIQLPIN